MIIIKEIKVLIIDDAYFFRNLLKKNILEKPIIADTTFTVIDEAKDGKEGISKYFDLNPNIITLDINMPNMNGVEVTKQILSKDSSAKIIVITGNTDENIKKEILSLGVLDYIEKPFQASSLWTKLDDIFSLQDNKEPIAKPLEVSFGYDDDEVYYSDDIKNNRDDSIEKSIKNTNDEIVLMEEDDDDFFTKPINCKDDGKEDLSNNPQENYNHSTNPKKTFEVVDNSQNNKNTKHLNQDINPKKIDFMDTNSSPNTSMKFAINDEPENTSNEKIYEFADNCYNEVGNEKTFEISDDSNVEDKEDDEIISDNFEFIIDGDDNINISIQDRQIHNENIYEEKVRPSSLPQNDEEYTLNKTISTVQEGSSNHFEQDTMNNRTNIVYDKNKKVNDDYSKPEKPLEFITKDIRPPRDSIKNSNNSNSQSFYSYEEEIPKKSETKPKQGLLSKLKTMFKK